MKKDEVIFNTLLKECFTPALFKDYLKSSHCGDCGGFGEVDGEQCFECENLHYAERMADRMHDAMKEGDV